jgi:hypothetical protein
VPDVFAEDVELNRRIVESSGERQVPEHVEKAAPTPDQVAANKTKWGYGG